MTSMQQAATTTGELAEWWSSLSERRRAPLLAAALGVIGVCAYLLLPFTAVQQISASHTYSSTTFSKSCSGALINVFRGADTYDIARAEQSLQASRFGLLSQANIQDIDAVAAEYNSQNCFARSKTRVIAGLVIAAAFAVGGFLASTSLSSESSQ